MPLLSIRNVSKAFGATYALKGVTFDLGPSECLVLVGENGAGKSTLMKILSGVWPHGSYEGHVLLGDNLLCLKDTLDGWNSGISIIHQELCLFPELTVAENLFLNEAFPYAGVPSQKLWSPVHWKSLYDRATGIFRELGFAVDARAKVRELSVAQRQLVEIARAFHHRSKILILDEPTSALSQVEVDQLFQVIRRMKDHISFIYISHKLEEVFAMADRIVILRDGQSVAELNPKSVTREDVIAHMVGRPVEFSQRKHEGSTCPPRLRVSELSHRNNAGENILDQITFDLHPGEVVGVAGLMGSGRSELLRSIVGILPGTRSGTLLLGGKPIRWTSIQEAMDAGIAFVPEDRKRDGLFLDHSVKFNLTLSILNELAGHAGVLDLAREKTTAARLVKELQVKCASNELPVRWLSGGNQQKVLLAKVLARNPQVLLLDEPTRGIDIGAKQEIYELIHRLRDQGLAILLVSSELPEILALSDRIIVLRGGMMTADLPNENLRQETILSFAAGVS